MLHRVLLASDDLDSHLNILNVVSKCCVGLQEHILGAASRSSQVESDAGGCKDGTSEDRSDAGDGRDSVIQSKKSVVFALLEIYLFVVSKYAAGVMPPDMPGSRLPTKKQGLFCECGPFVICDVRSALGSCLLHKNHFIGGSCSSLMSKAIHSKFLHQEICCHVHYLYSVVHISDDCAW